MSDEIGQTSGTDPINDLWPASVICALMNAPSECCGPPGRGRCCCGCMDKSPGTTVLGDNTDAAYMMMMKLMLIIMWRTQSQTQDLMGYACRHWPFLARLVTCDNVTTFKNFEVSLMAYKLCMTFIIMALPQDEAGFYYELSS